MVHFISQIFYKNLEFESKCLKLISITVLKTKKLTIKSNIAIYSQFLVVTAFEANFKFLLVNTIRNFNN